MIRTEREYRKAVRRLDAAADAEAIASRGLTEDEAKRALDHLVRAIHGQLLKELEGYERLTDVDDAEASRRAARLTVCPRCLGRPRTGRPADDGVHACHCVPTPGFVPLTLEALWGALMPILGRKRDAEGDD